MRFRSEVEPPEPMRGLEVPPEVVEALEGGKRPRVRVTLNGHSWSTRIAIMRGRHLIGLSKANRAAAGVAVGDQVEVEVALEAEPVSVDVPADFATALDGTPAARAAYERLTLSQQRQHVRVIEAAKKPETRAARITKAVAELSAR
ncbi:YdeI/OmpD-associated family protein [Nocardioides sp. CCNWLW239]|uniref:YdeI/OmpD-associated family protein n=1 Tax=Nocardioides sp. CCNWLW239 TaxID=3128902 RepID=UPI00301ABD83